MGLTVSDGSLVYKSGSLGTGENCCCKPGPCDAECSGSGVPETITFTISNAAGIAFEDFDPNGTYVLPNSYDVFEDCFYYRGQFNPYDPFCPFPFLLVGTIFQAEILVFPDSVFVILSERTSGGCVGDASSFTLANWQTKICARPTDFPISGTATTASSSLGSLSFDWSIDL